MANIWRMLDRNVLSTLSRSISAKSVHLICFDALLTSVSILLYLQRPSAGVPRVYQIPTLAPHLSMCLATAFLQFSLAMRSPGIRRHCLPSFSTSFLVSSASPCSSGK